VSLLESQSGWRLQDTGQLYARLSSVVEGTGCAISPFVIVDEKADISLRKRLRSMYQLPVDVLLLPL
jgi:hypothetical protein